MKQKNMILTGALLLALCLTLTACGSSPRVGDAFAGEVNNYEGVTMTVVEGTATPGGVTVEVLNTTEAEIDACVQALRQYHDTRMPML